MAAQFCQESPQLVQDLESACNSGDGATAGRLAHTLKANCLTFQAEETACMAQRVEDLATNRQLSEAAELLPDLAGQIERLCHALKGLLPAGQ